MQRFYIYKHGPRRMICDSHTGQAILGLEPGLDESAALHVADVCVRALNSADADAKRTVRHLKVFCGINLGPDN